MTTQRVVVTGATGFTGFALAAHLQQLGYDTLALVRATSDVSLLEERGIGYVRVDLADPVAVAQALAGAHWVFHLAAAYRAEHADQQEFWRVNVEMTRVLLEASAKSGVARFIHCSTVGVQGEITEAPADENYRLKPGDHYQESKLEGERLAIEFNSPAMETTVVRPVGIYGPGDTRFLKLFKAINRRMFVMIGSGETWYHLTYIDDLVNGFCLAAQRPQAAGEVFTICGARYTTLNELVSMIGTTLSVKPSRFKIPLWPVLAAAHVADWTFKLFNAQSPLYPRRVEFFALSRAFTAEKAERLLGYSAGVSLEEGLSKTAAWYKEQQLL